MQNTLLEKCGLQECPERQMPTLDVHFLQLAAVKTNCSRALTIKNIYKLDSWLLWIGCVPIFEQSNESFARYAGVSKKDYDQLLQENIQQELARLEKTEWLNQKTPIFEEEKEIIFVEQIVVPAADKVLIIGDVHSSLTSLLSILKTWHQNDLLSNEFQLYQGYHLFFLGDVFDRGPYGTELVTLIFLLKRANPGRVTYINGNHENCETYSVYGMADEILNKFGAEKDISFVIQHLSFLQYQPSAVILKYGLQNFQLSHGAFTENMVEQDKIAKLVKSNKSFLFLRDFAKSCKAISSHGIDNQKWGDFVGTRQDGKISNRGEFIKVFGWQSTQKYLCKIGLTAIISGHQDLSNFSMLLSPTCSKDGKERDPNYKTLFRPIHYGSKTVSFKPKKDFIAVNTSTAIDAKKNAGLQFDCFLLLHYKQ